MYVCKRYRDQYPGSPPKTRGVVIREKLTVSNTQVVIYSFNLTLNCTKILATFLIIIKI